MGSSNQLRERDLTAIVQLVHECGELWADADAWQKHLLNGACRLTGTAVGHYNESRIWPDRRWVEILDEMHCGWRDDAARAVRDRLLREHPDRAAYMPKCYGLALAALAAPDVTALRPQMTPDRAWYRSAMFNGYHRPSHVDGFVMSFALNRQTGNIILLEVCQDLSDPAPTPRAKRIISLLNRQVTPMVGTVLATNGQRGMRGLSPRLRQTLDALLEGDSEKQIAARLGLHRPTVHEYVGSLYRHFGVSSRGELMAYFVRRKPQPTCVPSMQQFAHDRA